MADVTSCNGGCNRPVNPTSLVTTLYERSLLYHPCGLLKREIKKKTIYKQLGFTYLIYIVSLEEIIIIFVSDAKKYSTLKVLMRIKYVRIHCNIITLSQDYRSKGGETHFLYIMMNANRVRLPRIIDIILCSFINIADGVYTNIVHSTVCIGCVKRRDVIHPLTIEFIHQRRRIT